MPFGLTNAPATFMRFINDVFRAHLGKFVVIYLDDILVFSKSWEDHLQHVRTILELLRAHHLQVKENKSYFGQTSVQYLGFIIDNKGVRPDPSRVQALAQWPAPSSAHDLKSFMGGINFYRKFVSHFSQLARPLHQLSHQVKFIWDAESEQHFAQLKSALCSAPVLRLPYMNQPFEIETDASQFAIGAVLKQGGHPVAYHSEALADAKLMYSTYDKEFYSLVQALKQWRHYILGKETILHTDHHPLIFINSQRKIQEQRHLKWASYIQQFHLVIKYKKGTSNKMVDLLSRPPAPVLHILEVRCAAYDAWKDMYATDPVFGEIWEALQHPTVINQTPFLDYTIRDGWLYKLNQLCVPQSDDRLILIREAHASSCGGHFGTAKTILNLQRHFYWPALPKQVEKFIRACSLCSQSKPSNRKRGLYQPLPIPSRPWESISMDFLSGLPTTFRKHDAIWVVVCRFSNMAIFLPCHKTTSAAQTADLFFHHVWPHFGLPSSIISDRDSRFLSTFWRTLWSLLGCQLRFSTAFHPQTDGQTEVVNRTLVHSLRSYFSKNKQWDTYLHIIQHSYNRATHSSTGFSPFEVCFGFQPSAPSEMPLTITPSGSAHQQQEQKSAHHFIHSISQRQTQVTAALQAAQARAKQRHDKQRTHLSFQPGDHVWLLLDKQRFKGQHHKLHPLRYGPYTVLERIGENAYRLDLPSQLGIHDVLNVNNLKLFEPPLLEESVTIHHPVDTIPDFQPPLLKDTILDFMKRDTRHQPYFSYLVGRKGHTPAKAKWINAETLQHNFPQLVEEAGTLPDLNREELGNQKGHKNQQHLTDWATKK